MKYINLGLPSNTLWADCNVGAVNPQDIGNYFTFYNAQNCGLLPTEQHLYELIDYTTHETYEINNIKGMRFVGINHNSIFIPFAGVFYASDSLYVEREGVLWSRTLNNDYSACGFYFNNNNISIVTPIKNNDFRFGHSVRLIKDI